MNYSIQLHRRHRIRVDGRKSRWIRRVLRYAFKVAVRSRYHSLSLVVLSFAMHRSIIHAITTGRAAFMWQILDRDINGWVGEWMVQHITNTQEHRCETNDSQ